VSGRRLIHFLELARVELLLAATSNVWLMTFFAIELAPAHGQANRRSEALDSLGLTASLVLVTLVALGLTGCGMAMNDVLDARHDRAFAPGRPIPAGRVDVTMAISAAMLGMLVGLAAAVPLGKMSMVMALLVAAGMLFYNLTGRFVPAVGIVSLGLITAASMLLPNPRPVLVWPIVLAMTHVMAAASLRHYLAGKRPRLSAIDGWGLCIGWAFWTLLLVGLISNHQPGGWPPPAPGSGGLGVAGLIRSFWAGPVVAIFGFVIVSWLTLRGRMAQVRSRRDAGRSFARLSALWLIIYNAAWLFSATLYWQAATIAALFPIACWLSRRRHAAN
jgi:4-hydroxybenzoate polyprenyltransferase